MATTARLIKTGKGVSIGILVLGIIHEVATFTPFIQEGMACMECGSRMAMTYMSLICGGFLILCGWLLFLFLKKLAEIPYLSRPIMIISVFSAINGALSVIYMTDNPFAWTEFILCAVMLAVATALRRGTMATTS